MKSKKVISTLAAVSVLAASSMSFAVTIDGAVINGKLVNNKSGSVITHKAGTVANIESNANMTLKATGSTLATAVKVNSGTADLSEVKVNSVDVAPAAGIVKVVKGQTNTTGNVTEETISQEDKAGTKAVYTVGVTGDATSAGAITLNVDGASQDVNVAENASAGAIALDISNNAALKLKYDAKVSGTTVTFTAKEVGVRALGVEKQLSPVNVVITNTTPGKAPVK